MASEAEAATTFIRSGAVVELGAATCAKEAKK